MPSLFASCRRTLLPTFLLFASLLFAGCGREGAPSHSTPVVWPELSAFDEYAWRAEGLAMVKDRDALLKMRTALLEAGWGSRSGGVPCLRPSRQESDSGGRSRGPSPPNRRHGYSLQEAIEVFHNNPCRFLGQNPEWDIAPIRVEVEAA